MGTGATCSGASLDKCEGCVKKSKQRRFLRKGAGRHAWDDGMERQRGYLGQAFGAVHMVPACVLRNGGVGERGARESYV